MNRRRRSKSSGGVQMFSFLDAMICTMGALLVLLHAFARHGQVEIAQKIEARTAREGQGDPKAERESLQWRVDQLKEARAKTEAQLAEERLKLSHVEDHERRLRENLEQLKIAVAEMERLDTAHRHERQQTQAELEAAKDQIRQARQAVEDARHQAQERSTRYSVVPYEGPNATHRRPIYLECRAHSIVLQPEGIELAPDDFAGLGPGNPLASALRGMREYLARQSPEAQPAQEPYPLLLVRPEGIEAYYAARGALDSWGSDFGYELVGSDWKFQFSEADPRLAELTRQIVAEARVRQREYLQSSPLLAKQRSRTTYHAQSRGGFAPERGGGGRGGSGGSGPGGWDTLGSNWARGGGATGGNSDNRDASDPSGSFEGKGPSLGTGGVDAGTEVAEGGPSGDAQGEATPSHGAFGPGQKATGGNPNSGQAQVNGSGPTGAQDDQAASEGSTSSGRSGSAGGSGSPSGSGASSSVSAGAPPSPFAPTSSAKKMNSLAKTRGRDWGLPESGVGVVAATRPILIECHNDHLVIVPESPNALPKEVRLGAKTQDAMDALVSDVWQHMKSWGVAGKGLYWRPELVMEIEPGAADRYAEIKALMADSGLDVHERQPRATAKGPASKTSRK